MFESESESSIDSDLLEGLESSDAPDNEHGFVFSHNLDTYKLSKRERIDKMEAEKEDPLERRKKY